LKKGYYEFSRNVFFFNNGLGIIQHSDIGIK